MDRSLHDELGIALEKLKMHQAVRGIALLDADIILEIIRLIEAIIKSGKHK